MKYLTKPNQSKLKGTLQTLGLESVLMAVA